MPPKTKFNMTLDDFLGYEPEEAMCKNCSDICGSKTPRLFRNKPIVICGGKNPGQEILAAFKSRKDSQ